MTESPDDRLKRVRMRSWRRGTKEMDLILGPYADAHLGGMDAATLDVYEMLLAENDQDLIGWVLGQTTPPEALATQIAVISDFARQRLSPKA
jgi:antitoxin CptB